MKMDRVSFAALIGYLTFRGLDHSFQTIETIDEMIDINVPVPAVPPSASCANVDALMAAIKSGRKIEAIKIYRNMTGAGLKESKDAVEAHAFFPPRGMYKTAETFRDELLATIEAQMNGSTGGSFGDFILDDFTLFELQTIRKFINSFNLT